MTLSVGWSKRSSAASWSSARTTSPADAGKTRTQSRSRAAATRTSPSPSSHAPRACDTNGVSGHAQASPALVGQQNSATPSASTGTAPASRTPANQRGIGIGRSRSTPGARS